MPERLVEAAGHIAQQKEKSRALALAEIRRRAPALAERLHADLTKVLARS
jgi:hypothetical protein